MSRINIDDALFSDTRFQLVQEKLGWDRAIGQYIKVLRIGLQYWKSDKGLIPKKVWLLHDIPGDFLNAELVEEREMGYYVKGSEKYFSWLYAKVQGGRSSRSGGRPTQRDRTRPSASNSPVICLGDSPAALKKIDTAKSNKNSKVETAEKQQKTAEKQLKTTSLLLTPYSEEKKNYLDKKVCGKKENIILIQSIVEQVLDHLFNVVGRRFMPKTPATRKVINARLKDGFNLKDFKTVIDKKSAQWLNTEQAMYLRPITLFGTKFEGYLNEPVLEHEEKQTAKYLDGLLKKMGCENVKESSK